MGEMGWIIAVRYLDIVGIFMRNRLLRFAKHRATDRDILRRRLKSMRAAAARVRNDKE
jgi:hypothetical protein